MAFFSSFSRSASELKTLRCLTTTAILVAFAVAIKYFTFYISDTLRISFDFVAIAAIAMLFGPTVAGFAGILIDVISYLLKPVAAFSPMITVVAMVTAVIYGVYLYGLKPVKFEAGADYTKRNVLQIIRIVLAEFTVMIVCNLALMPFALIFSGFATFESMTAGYPVRLVKSLAQFPVNIVLLLAVLPAAMLAYRRATRNSTARS